MRLSLHRPAGLCAAAIAVASLPFLSPAALAGPPFLTDDPEPVDYHHWEVYVATQHTQASSGVADTFPHVEVNYGAAPNTQLHLIAPFARSVSGGAAGHYGLGDLELGVKYRFVQETASRPQIGVFPLAEIPTGSAEQGLGNGVAQFYFPVWLQKSWGTWTTYGGGGYWSNPGAGNRDFWFTGWLLQKSVTSHTTLGAELFHTTPQHAGETDETGVNFGAIYDIDEGHHLLFSAGAGLHGPVKTIAYAAYQWTFGPHEKAKEETTPTH